MNKNIEPSPNTFLFKQKRQQLGYKLKNSILIERYGMLIVFFLLILTCSLLSDIFLRPSNLVNILRQVAIVGILATAQTLVILTAGIDLSVGSIMAFSTLILAGTQDYGWGIALAVALFAGLFFGFINGFIITKGKVQPFVVTLAMMSMLVGLGLTYSGGHPILGTPEQLKFISHSRFLGLIPFQAVLYFSLVIIIAIMLKYTRFGRHIYAVGGNPEASQLSGINVDMVKVKVYSLCGLLSGIAGVIMATYLNVGEANLGRGYELDAIAAVVVGGTSLMGGIGGVGGTVIGVLIIGVLNNLLNLLNVPGYTQLIFKGAIIVLAVVLQSRLRKVS